MNDTITLSREQYAWLTANFQRALDAEERAAERADRAEMALRLLQPHCRFCDGLGAVLREDRRGRVTEWPCIADCPPPLAPIRINNRRR